MKKLLLLLFIAVSLSSFSQTKNDSIQAGRFVDSFQKATSIYQFEQWVRANGDNISVIQFNHFISLYNSFIQQQYYAWIQRKKKVK